MPNFCTKCGHRVSCPETDSFCANCGASLKKFIIGLSRRDSKNNVNDCSSSPACRVVEEAGGALVPKRNRSMTNIHEIIPPPPPPRGPPPAAALPAIDTAEQVALTLLTRQHSQGIVGRSRSLTCDPDDWDESKEVPKARSFSEQYDQGLDPEWLQDCPVSLDHEKTGWLHRQGHDILGQWKKRWFKLACGILFYFNKPLDEKAIGSIPLKNSIVEVMKKHSKKFVFRVMVGTLDGKCHTLQAESLIDLNHWVDGLVAHGATVYDPEIHEWKPITISSPSTNKKDQQERKQPVSPKMIGRNPELSVETPIDPSPVHRSSPMLGRTLHRAYSAPTHQKAIEEIGEKMKEKNQQQQLIALKQTKGRSSSSNAIVKVKTKVPPVPVSISGPVLLTKPNPIYAPKKPENDLELDSPIPSRELLFSPQSKAKILRYGAHSECGTCGYRTAYFMTYCGSCGARFMGIENVEKAN